MKYCKNCGAELNDNAVVCTKCGVLVGDGNKFCPNCGAEPDPLAVICVKCGYELKPLKSNSAIIYRYANLKTSDTVNHDSDFVWAIKTCFAKYSTFSGRARRKEFWYWYLFTCLPIIVVFVLALLVACTTMSYAQTVQPSNTGMGLGFFEIVIILWNLIICLPSLAVTVRRLHDAGHSGWYYLISMIPLIGVILLFVALCTDSVEDNQYGENPKVKMQHNN